MIKKKLVNGSLLISAGLFLELLLQYIDANSYVALVGLAAIFFFATGFSVLTGSWESYRDGLH